MRFWLLLNLFCVLPGVTWAVDCPLLSIRSTKVIEGRRFVQFGEGWSIRIGSLKEVFVLTPAHVVFEADEVQTHCQSKVWGLTKVGLSETLDLAVYRVNANEKETNELQPMLTLSLAADANAYEIKKNFDFYKAIKKPWRGGSLYLDGNGYDFIRTIIINDEQPWAKDIKKFPQYPYVYVNTVNAIRPGMSGSPFFDSLSEPPLGMNLKTLSNDHISMVLPMPLLLTYLTDLFRGTDPWKKAHPQLFIQFHHQYDQERKELHRFRQLVVIDREKPLFEKYQETCAIGKIVESSQWMATGGSWADGGGSWADGGGSWGEAPGGTELVLIRVHSTFSPVIPLAFLGTQKNLTPANF